MKKIEEHRLKALIYEHILGNSKLYILVVLIFLIGIFSGVMIVNSSSENEMLEISSFLNEFINKFKEMSRINSFQLLKNSLFENIILAVSLWFFGTTVIGIPVVLGIIGYRGFCLGYTISAITTTLGTGKGIAFIIMSIFLQNLIVIPAMIVIAVSGIKLYKSIIKDRNRRNIKLEIMRHTIMLLIVIFFLCIASILEILISTNLLKNFIKYF